MVLGQQKQKPGVEEWAEAGEVLADRLAECVHAYKHNTYIFMSESERQHKTGIVIKLLQGLHALLDELEASADSPKQALDEEIVHGFVASFTEALKILPWLSTDMQKLLKSPWMKGFPGKVAESLFWGNGEENKGIGSGSPEHGRLPGVLADLLEREELGDVRAVRKGGDGGSSPSRKDKDKADRWHEQNAGYLRTAGRVE
ncbi:MAG: hypothetical protein PHW76_03935 [Alphaproteobacteria bacterium]|nr:hypothetical protein [Alphaproteobacteria bacterium]